MISRLRLTKTELEFINNIFFIYETNQKYLRKMLELRLAYNTVSFLSPVLKIGITLAIFNSSGNNQFSNEELIRRVSGFT